MKIIKYIILLLLTIILLFPLYFMIKGSFENIIGIMKFPPSLIPNKIILDNYNWFFQNNKMLTYIINTCIISIAGVLIMVIISGLSGYAFSIFKFKGKKVLFWAFMISLMVPGQALIVSKFVIIKEMGMLDTYYAVILPMCFAAVNIFLYKNYCDTIPIEIIESARIDGASEFLIFWKISLPLCKPIIGAIAIFGFIGILSDYLWQMLVLRKEGLQTLIVGIIYSVMSEAGAQVNRIGIQLAAGTILFIPLLIVFCVFSRYFIKGISLGGVKE